MVTRVVAGRLKATIEEKVGTLTFPAQDLYSDNVNTFLLEWFVLDT